MVQSDTSDSAGKSEISDQIADSSISLRRSFLETT